MPEIQRNLRNFPVKCLFHKIMIGFTISLNIHLVVLKRTV